MQLFRAQRGATWDQRQCAPLYGCARLSPAWLVFVCLHVYRRVHDFVWGGDFHVASCGVMRRHAASCGSRRSLPVQCLSLSIVASSTEYGRGFSKIGWKLSLSEGITRSWNGVITKLLLTTWITLLYWSISRCFLPEKVDCHSPRFRAGTHADVEALDTQETCFISVPLFGQAKLVQLKTLTLVVPENWCCCKSSHLEPHASLASSCTVNARHIFPTRLKHKAKSRIEQVQCQCPARATSPHST